MLAPQTSDRIERLQRASQRWRNLALSALFALTAVVMISATLLLIEKRQNDQPGHGGEQAGVPAEQDDRAPTKPDKDYLDQRAERARRNQDRAVAAILKLGGQVKRERNQADQPVIAVSYFGTPVTDADLVRLVDLPQLRDLSLDETNITDDGLAHLRGLTRLEKLDLRGTPITDQGLAYLRGLTDLRELDLFRTQVTDKGLQHLKGLLKLQTLNLFRTKVTEAGVKELQGALPAVKIVR
jgi:hypothetical protein